MEASEVENGGGMSWKMRVLLAIGIYLLITIVLVVVAGNAGKNEEFQPQNEFLLEPWISLDLGFADLSINKAVLYLFLAAGATIAAMTWISKRMEAKPNKIQMAVEVAYDLTRNNIAGNIPEDKLARKWFPYLATLFFFIWFSATSRCRPTRSTRSTSSGSRCRRSRSTRRPRTSRSRSCSRSSR